MLPAVFQRILGSNSLFKAATPPHHHHSSNHALRLCYSVIMVSKHTLTSCLAHFKLTNGWPVNCTAGLHPPQNNQTNFDHPRTQSHAYTQTQTAKKLVCCSVPLSLLISFINIFPNVHIPHCLKVSTSSNPLEVTTHPDPLGLYLFFFSKHRCCPSVFACLVALPLGGCLLAGPTDMCGGCRGTIPVYACHSTLHSVTHTLITPQSFSWA